MFNIFKIHFLLFSLLLFIAACGGGSNNNSGEETKTSHNLPVDGKPGSVANVVAVAGDGSVIINWQAPATGGKVDYYIVDKTIDNKISYTTVDPTVNGDTTTVTDSNAQNGKSHIYRVTAANSIATGAAVHSQSVMPKTGITPIVVTTIKPDEVITSPTINLAQSIESSLFGKSVAYSSDGFLLAVSENTVNPLVHVDANVLIFDKLKFATTAINPWKLKQTITSFSNGFQTDFGAPIAFSNNGFTLAISASSATVAGNLNAGVVEIYTNATGSWILAETLQSPAPVNGELFGSTIAFSPDGFTLAISENSRGTTITNDTGTVYVFDKLQLATVPNQPWFLTQTLTTTQSTVGQFFGVALAFSPDGTTLAVGESRANKATAGSVQLFTKPDLKWTPTQTISSVTKNESQFFGISIAFSSDSSTLAVSETKDITLNKANTVQLFNKTGATWIAGQVITAAAPSADNGFGINVSFSPKSNLLAISDIYTDSTALNTGRVSVYDKIGTNWKKIKILGSQSPALNNLFGSNVTFSIDGRYITIGEPTSGVVNIFDSFKFK